MIVNGYLADFDPSAYWPGATAGVASDQPYTVDVGRPDMPVTQTSVDPITGQTTLHVTGSQPITSFYASQGLDSSGNAPGSSSDSGGGFLSTLGKLFGGGGGGTPAYTGASMASGIPTWAWIVIPAGALMVGIGLLSERRRGPVPATAGYRRRRRRR